MRCLAAAPLLLLLLAVVPSQAGFFDDIAGQIRAMFQTYEAAPYTVVDTVNGYEERLYPARKWVCKAENNNPEVGEDLGKLFWPLFTYISGQNQREEKIAMTVPVSTKFTVRSATDKTYEMCFYIGEEHQQNPAEPTPESGVYIQSRPQNRVLTRTVGGYMTGEEDWMEEAGELAVLLQENGITVDLSNMYWVGYDSPMKFWNRRNEVWFPLATE